MKKETKTNKKIMVLITTCIMLLTLFLTTYNQILNVGALTYQHGEDYGGGAFNLVNLVDFGKSYGIDVNTGLPTHTFYEYHIDGSGISINYQQSTERLNLSINSIHFTELLKPNTYYMAGWILKDGINFNSLTYADAWNFEHSSELTNSWSGGTQLLDYELLNGLGAINLVQLKTKDVVFSQYYLSPQFWTFNIRVQNDWLQNTPAWRSVFMNFILTNYDFVWYEETYNSFMYKYSMTMAQYAFADGVSHGYSNGYFAGVQDAENGNFKNIYDSGFENGYNSGYSDGLVEGAELEYTRGYNLGYNVGYGEGYAIGESETASGFQGLMILPATMLGTMFKTTFNWLNFTVLGINLWSILVLMSSFSILVLFLKMWFGR